MKTRLRFHLSLRFSALLVAAGSVVGCAASNDEADVGGSTSAFTTAATNVGAAEAETAGLAHVRSFKTIVRSPRVADTYPPTPHGYPDAYRVIVHADPTPEAAAECLFYSAQVFVSTSTGAVLDRARWVGGGIDLFTSAEWNCYPVDNGFGGGT